MELPWNPDILADNLRRARQQLGLTQVQVEAQTGIAQSLVSRYERGHDVPSPGHLEALRGLYQTSPEELYGFRGFKGDDGQVHVIPTWKLLEKLRRAVGKAGERDLLVLDWVADEILGTDDSDGHGGEPADLA